MPTYDKSFTRNHHESSTIKSLQNESSEAVLQFSRDFDLMRKKFGEMHAQMSGYQNNIGGLMKEVKELKDENLKLTTDIKVIRNEHSEMAHTIYTLE